MEVDEAAYLPPPGTERPNRPGVQYDPAETQIARPNPRAAAPDPRTRPMFVYRSDAPRRRLPRQIPPRRIEEDYGGALARIVRRACSNYGGALIRALPSLLPSRGDRMDADARSLLAAAAARARAAIGQPQLEALARKIAGRTSSYHKEQLGRQVRAALGADPVFRDRGLAARADHFAKENAALIKRIPQDMHASVEALVRDAVAGGRRAPEDLARDIRSRFGVAERHARVIARDQVGKYYSALNHARQRELGVERFVWRTVGDERVRDEHAELDGRVFSYDDPPEVDGEETLPGEGVQCRCWAEAVFDDILGGDDEDTEESADDED